MATLTNLCTNPQPKLSDVGWSVSAGGGVVSWGRFGSGFSGNVLVTNLATNPSFETASGTVTVRENLASQPRGSNWSAGAGTGGTGVVSYIADARFPSGICTRETWTVAPTDLNGLYIGAVSASVRPSVAHTISVYVAQSSYLPNVGLSGITGSGVLSSRTDKDLGNGVTRYSWIFTPNAGITNITFVLIPGVLPTTSTVWEAGALLVEEGSVLGEYFDGSTPAAGDFSYAWIGTPDASTSVQTGTTVVGLSGSNTLPIQSSEWSESSAHSVRLVANTSSNVTSTIIPTPVAAGKSYTVLATYRLEAPLTGTLYPYYVGQIALLQTGAATIQSEQLPNEAGEQTVRWTFTVDPAATGAQLRLGHGGAQGSGDVWWDDLLIVEVPDVDHPYTGPYFDGGSAWTAENAFEWTDAENESTSVMYARDAADAYMEATWTTASGLSDGHVQYTQPVTPGLPFSAGIEVVPSRLQTFTPTIVFVDTNDQVLQTVYGTDVVAPANVATRILVGGMTVPANAVEAWITAATSLDNGTPWQVGDTLKTSRAIATTSLSVPPYFDGSYPGGAWSGAEYASTSWLLASTAPALTPLPDWSPVPRMGVSFTSLHPLCQTITVWRIVGNQQTRVRAAINRYAVGGFGVQDFEAPKVTATYRAEQFDSDGASLGYTDSATAVLNFDGECIHQPLDPTLNVKYVFASNAVADLVQPSPGNLYYPEGRGEPVWVGSQRQGLVGVNLDGITETLADAAAIESLFGTPEKPQTPILCVRTANMDLPPTLFAVVPEPHRVGLTRNIGGELISWKMSGTQVAPPAPGLIAPLLTYDDLDAAYATYDDRDAHYSSYLEQDTDWSLSGFAI